MAGTSLASSLTLRLRPGDFLFREGEPSKDLYIVKFGTLRVFKTEAGVEIDLATAQAGTVVGEVAAIDDGNRSASCTAVETSELIVVPVEDFRRILGKIPDWFRKLANVLVVRLREVDAKIHRAMNGDCVPQVARLTTLIACSPLAQRGERTQIEYESLEKELVNILQMRPSDISNALQELCNKGCFKISKGSVIIDDLRQLEEMANVAPTTSVDEPLV